MRTLICAPLLMLSAHAVFAQTPVVNGVMNIAGPSSAPGVAPGSLVSIFGTDLATDIATSDSMPLSTSVAGVNVTIGGIAAPVQFVSKGQVNAQVPWSVPLGDSTPVVVTRDSGSSTPVPVSVVATAPAIFNIGGQAIAANADGTLAAPAGGIPGIATRPAKIGDTTGLVILASGLGVVDSAIADGANSLDATRNTLAKPTVLIGGVPAQVTFSGLAPQYVGINQINVVVADGTPAGNAVPVQIQVNGVNSNTVFIAVSQ
jgi:uncharacterized protein (TIGR03437 family)